MTKEKQIEEMANVMVDENNKEVVNALSMVFASSAEVLYNAGYRKAEDIAREIFAEIDKIIDKHYNKHIFYSDLEDTEKEAVMDFSGDVTYDIDKLKEKYAEDGE